MPLLRFDSVLPERPHLAFGSDKDAAFRGSHAECEYWASILKNLGGRWPVLIEDIAAADLLE